MELDAKCLGESVLREKQPLFSGENKLVFSSIDFLQKLNGLYFDLE
jgi:hypothetical protein